MWNPVTLVRDRLLPWLLVSLAMSCFLAATAVGDRAGFWLILLAWGQVIAGLLDVVENLLLSHSSSERSVAPLAAALRDAGCSAAERRSYIFSQARGAMATF
jgi:hypothetical protein